MKILALESSATAASAAVCEEERLIAQSQQCTGLTHSATLMPMTQALLKNAGLTLADIDVFAVAAGPGSFTGLRIGVSAVKGLAWALERPCAACSTLESMAWQVAHMDGEICSVMDARRGQVYNARFAAEEGHLVRLSEDRAISLEELAAEAKKSGKLQIIVGDGAALCYNAFQEQGLSARLAPPHLRYQTAWGVARCAVELCRKDGLISAAALSPDYHRLSQAERERLKKEKGTV